MKVGSRVKHVLMGWPGIIVLDLRGNPFAGSNEHFKVRFDVDGELVEKHVSEVELEHIKE